MVLKARAHNAPWHEAVEILLIDKHNPMGYGTNIEFTQIPNGQIVDPTFKLDFDDAQTLMDDLWNCGLRPSEGTGSAGALAATQKHLEDMRKLVFEK